MSNFLKCECPHCGVNIEYVATDAGRTCDCPKCGNVFELPVPKARIVEPLALPSIASVKPKSKLILFLARIYVCVGKAGLITFAAIVIVFGLIVYANKNNQPQLTPEQQKQQEERWHKTEELAAQRAAQDAQKQAAKHKTVNAGISYDDYNVRIKNIDANDWPELNVYINPGFLGPLSGYGIRLPALEAGKGITIPLEQFTKDNGERFNPSAYRVTELWIGGGDYDYEKFGPN